jgi:hypothetical protein
MHTRDATGKSEALRRMEAALAPQPSHLSFFYTDWDIQVQEWYDAAQLPEPAYTDDETAQILKYNALPDDYHHIKSMKMPNGGKWRVLELEKNSAVIRRNAHAVVEGRTRAADQLSSLSMRSKDGQRYLYPKREFRMARVTAIPDPPRVSW